MENSDFQREFQYQQQLRNLQTNRLQSTQQKIKKSGKIISNIETLATGGTLQAVKLSREHREALKYGDFSVFFVPFTLALMKDGFLDLVGSIPIIGVFLVMIPSLSITIHLFIFLFGHGLWWKKRAVQMLIRAFCFFLFLDYLPIINIIPWTTLGVFLVYRDAKKDYETAKRAEKTVLKQEEKDRIRSRSRMIRAYQ